MKARDLRELSEDRLRDRAASLKAEYEELREEVHSGKEKNHASLAGLRRDVARTITVLREKGGAL